MNDNDNLENPLELDYFKVDATSVPVQDVTEEGLPVTNCLVIYNVNVPKFMLTDRYTFERVKDLMLTDFGSDIENGADIYFDVSATVLLRHRNTGQQKFFLGSFNPRGRTKNQVSSFRTFEPASFPDFALYTCHPNYVQRAMLIAGEESVWEFEKLFSVILSFQTKLPFNSNFFAHIRPGLRHGPVVAGERGGAANIRRPQPQKRFRRKVIKFYVD